MPIVAAEADSLVRLPSRKVATFLAARRRLIQRYGNATTKASAKQLPPYGQECPEYAGVAELPHPQLLLYQAGDDGQESDEYDRCKNDEFQRTPSPEDAVISCSSVLLASKQPWPLAMCRSLDHCSTSFPLVRDGGILSQAGPTGQLTLR